MVFRLVSGGRKLVGEVRIGLDNFALSPKACYTPSAYRVKGASPSRLFCMHRGLLVVTDVQKAAASVRRQGVALPGEAPQPRMPVIGWTSLLKVVHMQNSPRKGVHRLCRSTLALIAAGCALLAAGLITGINDNPPGIALVYLAVSAWIAALVHRWRRVKSFLILLIVSLVGFFLFAVLHNLFYALAQMASDLVGLVQVLQFLHVVFFLIALLVCPPGVLIGAVGSVVLALLRLRKVDDSDDPP